MQKRAENILIFILRVSMGWVFLFAAIRQIPDPNWSAEAFLGNASLFPSFFSFFTSPEILPLINIVIPWAHLLIGVALITGLGMRLASTGGALLMFLYYLPRLDGFMIGPHNFIVEYHLVYTIIIVYLAVIQAGKIYGLEGVIAQYPELDKTLRSNIVTKTLLF